MVNIFRKALTSASLLFIVLLMSGFKFNSPKMSLNYNRINWDTVQIHPYFTKKTFFGFGKDKEVYPDKITVSITDSDGNVIYKNDSLDNDTIPVPDKTLGDQEDYTIKVCGVFNTNKICKNIDLQASPKSILMFYNLDYPEDDNYVKMDYDFTFELKRKKFNNENDSEIINSDIPLKGFLKVYIGSDKKHSIKVPIHNGSDTVYLNNYQNFSDFKDSLKKILDRDHIATVNFQLFLNFKDEQLKFSPIEKIIRVKTQAEREAEAKSYADSAGKQIMNKFGGGKNFYTKITNWSYNNYSKKYEIKLEIHWDGAIFSWHHYEIDGILTVNEDGTDSEFTATWKNDRLKSLESLRNAIIMTIGTAVILGTLANDNNDDNN